MKLSKARLSCSKVTSFKKNTLITKKSGYEKVLMKFSKQPKGREVAETFLIIIWGYGSTIVVLSLSTSNN